METISDPHSHLLLAALGQIPSQVQEQLIRHNVLCQGKHRIQVILTKTSQGVITGIIRQLNKEKARNEKSRLPAEHRESGLGESPMLAQEPNGLGSCKPKAAAV